VPEGVLPDSVYLGRVLSEVDRRLAAAGLTFYLTQDLEALPSYGPDVVAIVLGDERTRVPSYFDRVYAIFKVDQTRPRLTSNVLREPSWANFWWLVSYLRLWAHHLPGATSYAWHRWRGPRDGAVPAPIWQIPVGVGTDMDMPLKPLAERRYDVYFSGSVVHRSGTGIRELIAPKNISRASMVDNARLLAARHPELSVEVAPTGEYLESLRLLSARHAERSVDDAPTGDHLESGSEGQGYSRSMMDAKIALVPRGTLAETARFWEALQYGCIPVVDTLPRQPRWLFEGAPVLRLSRWDELEGLVVPLLANEHHLRRLHERSLEWWRTRGSDEAVGAYMAGRLNGLAR
jgi:hypothetical protein